MDLIPLIMKMPTRHQATKRGRSREMTGGPLSSMRSEAFRVSRYQKYMEGVVRSHSGSGGIWLWSPLLDRVTVPLFINPSPTPPSSHFFFLPTTCPFFIPPHSFLLFQIPFHLSVSPFSFSFTSSSPKPLEFFRRGQRSHGTENWKVWPK